MPSRQEYVEMLKAAFIAIGKRSVDAFLIAYLPPVYSFLQTPIIKQIYEHYRNKYWEWAADKGEFGAFILFVDIRVGGEKNDFIDAVTKNYQAQHSGTKEEQDAAEKDLCEKHRIFIKLVA